MQLPQDSGMRCDRTEFRAKKAEVSHAMSKKLASLTMAVSLAVPVIAEASHESHASKIAASSTAPSKANNGNNAVGRTLERERCLRLGLPSDSQALTTQNNLHPGLPEEAFRRALTRPSNLS